MVIFSKPLEDSVSIDSNIVTVAIIVQSKYYLLDDIINPRWLTAIAMC